MMSKIIVVGAGQAGYSCVAELCKKGFGGQIILIGEEEFLPYQRPPLSKKYLRGERKIKRLYLRTKDFYTAHGIDLRLGYYVESIDVAAQTLQIDSDEIKYDRLVLSTGARPRRLPATIGGNLNGVYLLRTINDVNIMAMEFRPGKRLLIVGGGYIGLEVAAVAADLGLDVVLLESAKRILHRVACRQTADFFRTIHQRHGVTIIEGVELKRLQSTAHRVSGVELSNGQHMTVDFVVVGIGVIPNVMLAKSAGLEIENGIKTDAFCRTSNPHIWAAGDCASLPYRGGRIRLENVQNAIDQAENVVHNIMGQALVYQPIPWFWSDQYNVKLQIAGLNNGYNDVVVRANGARSSFWYYRDAQLLAVDAINDPRSYMVAKQIIEADKTLDKTVVQDTNANLKSHLKRL